MVSQSQVHLKPNARPHTVLFKPHTVLFALKPAIEQELDYLESAGIIHQVPTSEWAAPTMPVPKKDDKIRICGDYKVTDNPVFDIEHYPLPKPQ